MKRTYAAAAIAALGVTGAASAQEAAHAETANDADYEVFEADAGLVFTSCEAFATSGARCALGGGVTDQHICLALAADETPLAHEVLLPGSEFVTFAELDPTEIVEVRCRQLTDEAPAPEGD
jgi:hypothetical protein